MVHRAFAIEAGNGRRQTDPLRRTPSLAEEQHKAGRLLFSGPTTDGAYGIYIMLASNLEEAKAIAAQDSHHVRGIRTMEVLEWDPRRAFRMNKLTIADVERMARDR